MRFKAELGTQRYGMLPAAVYEQALAWIQDQTRRYLPDDDEALPSQQRRLLWRIVLR